MVFSPCLLSLTTICRDIALVSNNADIGSRVAVELAKLRNGHRDSLAKSGLGSRVRVEQRKAEDAISHPQKRPVSFIHLLLHVVLCFKVTCLKVVSA